MRSCARAQYGHWKSAKTTIETRASEGPIGRPTSSTSGRRRERDGLDVNACLGYYPFAKADISMARDDEVPVAGRDEHGIALRV
ncbi:MAG TPA: hypothetical protein VF981_01615, partial [Gemmatimonadaceae bacterium]